MRILIAIPTYDRRVDIEIARQLLHLEREGHDFDVVFPVSSHISRNRNYAVHAMLKGEYSYLLFWDSDIAPDGGFLRRMLDTAYKWDADIVCGCYRFKDGSDKWVLGTSTGKGHYVNLVDPIGDKPFEVDAGGTGLMLVRRKVFEMLPDPWFTIQDGADLFTLPEDFLFCGNAKSEGLTIVAEPGFRVKHYGHHAYE